MVSWMTLLSLSRSGTIGQDEVEVTFITIFSAVFKANEGVNLSASNLLVDLSLSWKLKHFCVESLDGYYL